MEEEIWKDIPNYEGCYQISNLGRLKSLDRIVKNKCNSTRIQKGKIMKPILNKRNGYVYYGLSKNGMKLYRAHVLILNTFIAKPRDNMQVNHVNGIKTDNRLENLEWCTPSENIIHSISIGLKRPSDKQKSACSKHNKENYSFPVIGTNIKTGEKIYSYSIQNTKKYGFSPSSVGICCRKLKSSTKGYVWEYANNK